MKNYKVIIPDFFNGWADVEDLKDMYAKGFYTNPNSPSPDRIVTIDGLQIDKESMLEIITKASPKLTDYQRLRKYPPIGEQLDMIWHAIDSGLPLDKTSDFYLAIKATKNHHLAVKSQHKSLDLM